MEEALKNVINIQLRGGPIRKTSRERYNSVAALLHEKSTIVMG